MPKLSIEHVTLCGSIDREQLDEAIHCEANDSDSSLDPTKGAWGHYSDGSSRNLNEALFSG